MNFKENIRCQKLLKHPPHEQDSPEHPTTIESQCLAETIFLHRVKIALSKLTIEVVESRRGELKP